MADCQLQQGQMVNKGEKHTMHVGQESTSTPPFKPGTIPVTPRAVKWKCGPTGQQTTVNIFFQVLPAPPGTMRCTGLTREVPPLSRETTQAAARYWSGLLFVRGDTAHWLTSARETQGLSRQRKQLYYLTPSAIIYLTSNLLWLI